MSTSEPTSEPPVAPQPSYIFTTGLDHTATQLIEFNNQTFQNYGLDPHCRACLYMRDARTGTCVGLARAAVRGSAVWVAGLAVIPEYRWEDTATTLPRAPTQRRVSYRAARVHCGE
ncbi:hypothetical protein BC937DRAFT_92789 [Endogone sp. FLAS-F59071]|nr:hypothetical protein BC937DRAFT_92789 [Endogone sp. FLAS-F59071]|eukprot:RUS15178.1 hypothetical protein BC937DRAFT_92789 [Endogone sp. FLAS-F59071]